MEKPENVKSIWDNGGETLDRFSIFFTDGDMLGLSDSISGHFPFSMFCEGQEGTHLGKKLEWDDLSEIVQKHIIGRST